MQFLLEYKEDLLRALGQVDLKKIKQAVEILKEARDSGHVIFTCGNGGSASTASHLACDLVKGASFQKDKKFKVISLADNMPTLTAYSNDVDYREAFVEQLKNFAQKGDAVIAISGSGNSKNVIKAVEYGNQIGCKTVALTGRDGGKLGQVAQLNIQVANPHMGRIEDVHLIICHMIAYYFMDL
ncbi:MAG: SIS domain-containing protein [Patescibacteria group bacterium]|nr:SIS domain-containing protein [Patescibacteria group bacterium]